MILLEFFLVEILNFFVLQLLCLRLTVGNSVEYDVLRTFQDGMVHNLPGTKHIYRYWCINGFILPFTGWSSDEIYIRKKQQPLFSIRISKKTEYEKV